MANESENCSDAAGDEGKQDIRGEGYGISKAEKKLHDSVNSGNVEEVRRLLAEGVRVDCADEHGMTPLQHAAYKGNLDLCQMFLSHGADVNSNSHEHGYTALMFAALSGKRDVVKLMLEHGACVGLENAVHRTASQMAAFVGQHEIVSLINNFFSRDDLEYYCQPRGFETQPKLPASLAPSLYQYILQVNLNPIRLSLHLRQNVELLNNVDCVTRVLDLLCEKMMKQRNTNEILAMKFCYLSYVLKQAAISYQQQQQRKAEDGNILEPWIKYLLKVNSDGLEENQEKLVRSMLCEFPYVECQILQQIVRMIASSALGNLTALGALSSCINGQRFASADDKPCSTCGELNAKTCQVCKSVFYCNRDCQKLHWFVHKKNCKTLAEEYANRQKCQAEDSKENREVGCDQETKEPNDGKESEQFCSATT